LFFRVASNQLNRHVLSNQREDLDRAIFHFTESILQLPLQHGPVVFGSLFSLASALVLRSNVSKQPEDAIYATKYLFYLRDQPHSIPGVLRHKVTASLVDALASQVKLEAGNVMQNIREMAVLSRELLTLETSDVDATHLIIILHAVVVSNIRADDPDQPLDELIDCLRAARKHRPDLHEGRIAFAMLLASRYCTTYVDDDYEEAASILDEIIIHTSGNKSAAKAHAFATGLATALSMLRSNICHTPENLEEAIYRTQTCVSSSSIREHFPFAASSIDSEVTAEQRFLYFGSIEGVKASSGDPLLSQPMPGRLESDQALERT
jgi:hypothetical protein